MKKSIQIVSICSIVLVLLIGLALGVYFAIVNNNMSGGDVDAPSNIVPDDDMEVNVAEGDGMSLEIKRMSANTASDDITYTINVVFNPVDVSNRTCTWSLSWNNANSAWVTAEKGSSLFLSPQSYVDYSLSANADSCTLILKKAFGEQIVLSATSEDNQSATASCTLDYVKRLSSIDNLTFSATDHEKHLNDGTDYTIDMNAGRKTLYVDNVGSSGTWKKPTVSYSFGVGTITPSDVSVSVKISFNTASDSYKKFSSSISNFSKEIYPSGLANDKKMCEEFFGSSIMSDSAKYNELVRGLGGSDVFKIDVKVSTSNGSVSKTYYLNADMKLMLIKVISIGLSDSNIKF